MKQALFVFIAAILVSACNNNKGWSTADKNSFISSCTQSATQEMGADKAQSYCSCMEQKLEVKYPNSQEANKSIMAPGAMQTPEMQAMIKDCLGENTGNNNNNNNNAGNPIGNPNGNNNGNNN